MNQIKISVIIPHYNTPHLLQRCIDSIPDREDVQLIIVDDNSSSNIVDFENFPGLCRKHTKIIFNKISHGAGHARNLGLPYAKGEWLLFADADDFFTTNAWEVFEQQMNSNADIIYFGITSADSDTLEPAERCLLYDRYVKDYCQKRDIESADRLRYTHDGPIGKLIRHKLVQEKNIVFDETRYCNDTIFSVKCALAAKHIDAVPNIVYCVTYRRGSLTTQMSREAILIRFTVILNKNKILREYHKHKYQTPFLFYFRQALRYGPATFFQMIRISVQYRANYGMELKRYVTSNISKIKKHIQCKCNSKSK